MVALLALAVAGAAGYLLREGVLNDQLRLLFFTPLTLFAVACLGLAILLLLMRGFSALLRLLAAWAGRIRGATLQLTFTHMARVPQQPVRMALLLALALGFTMFSLVFVASQARRVSDIANYQVGADIYGQPAEPQDTTAPAVLRAQTQAYQHIPGVVSATLGYTTQIVSMSGGISFRVAAVDSSTFARTTRWVPTGQAPEALMKRLVPAGGYIIGPMPVIVDNETWQALNLSTQPEFSLKLSVGDYYRFECIAVAHVDSLPLSGGEGTHGILLDYQVFTRAYEKLFGKDTARTNLAANAVWLRVKDEPGAAQKVSAALARGRLRLEHVVERQDVITNLSHDPLYSSILNGIVLGALTTLLLAFVGNLIGAWQRARLRRTNLVVLRALGATPAQIGEILNWEQCLITLIALVLGGGLGALLLVWLIPRLVFTGITAQESSAVSLEQFYARQVIPPVQIVIPPTLLLALASVIVLCVCCLLLVTRAGSGAALSQALRMNED